MNEKLDEIFGILGSMITKEYFDNKVRKLKEDIRVENKELIERLEGRIFELETENEEQKEAQTSMESKFNDLEQYGRKNSVRIFGLEDPS